MQNERLNSATIGKYGDCMETKGTNMEWQPIETAPKDGTTVLVCLPRIMNLIIRASYSKVYGYWKTDLETDGGITRPTFFHKGDYWMPLPPPPTE